MYIVHEHNALKMLWILDMGMVLILTLTWGPIQPRSVVQDTHPLLACEDPITPEDLQVLIISSSSSTRISLWSS